MSSRPSAIVLIAGTVAVLSAGVRADTFYVDDDNCPGPGSGAVEDPFCLIQDAIDAAVTGDEVIVAPGTYAEAITIEDKAIELYSSDGSEVTVIDATGLGQVSAVTCTDARPGPTIRGFTITGGTGTDLSGFDFGGGILSIECSPSVVECVVIGNSADNGGGMALLDVHQTVVIPPVVAGCVFSGNSAQFRGGGVFNWRSDGIISGCVFAGNSAGVTGGGMYNAFYTDPTITGCTFADNSAGDFGGGMLNTRGTSPVVTGCFFDGNTAADGGGMLSSEAFPILTNCTFESNAALNAGGAMHGIGAGATVTNCTYSLNAAANGRALAFDSADGYGSSSMTMTNSIVWTTGDGIWNNDESLITIEYSDVAGGWPGDGNIDDDPQFVDPDGGDFRLSPGSSCIDAGINAAVPGGLGIDAGGDPRFVDDPGTPDCAQAPGTCGEPPVVDMGAYEFQGVTPCLWDCGDGDTEVGIADLLALLGQWGAVDVPCDFGLGASGVGVEELLKLLASWGPCP